MSKLDENRPYGVRCVVKKGIKYAQDGKLFNHLKIEVDGNGLVLDPSEIPAVVVTEEVTVSDAPAKVKTTVIGKVTEILDSMDEESRIRVESSRKTVEDFPDIILPKSQKPYVSASFAKANMERRKLTGYFVDKYKTGYCLKKL